MSKTSSVSTSNSSDQSESDTKRFSGIVIHDGFVSGRALRKASGFPNIEEVRCDSPDHELNRLEKALKKAIEDLGEMLSALDPDSESHAIFSSHQLMLQDPVLLGEVRKSIQNQHLTADYAWISALKTYYEHWKRAAKGSNLDQRSSDILDIANRVYRLLDGSEDACDSTIGILVTEELSASDALALDPSFVKGVVSEKGNETSHSAILIRSKGIPAVFGIRDICKSIQNDIWIAINGENGDVFVGYDSEIETSINDKKALYDKKMVYYSNQVREKPDFSGQQVHLLANVSSVEQIHDAIKHGAQGVGLFRTEFLYLNRSSPPSEDEQFKKYHEAVKAVRGQKLVIRTADFGGDKPISYLMWDSELNPFLGKRGIRYSLSEESLFKTQLRAVLRAAHFGKIDVMFPMISTVDEIIEVKSRLKSIINQLKKEGAQIGEIAIGVMIEVPSAALQISDILKEVDFVSIGTNDLIQYVMAVDRTLDTLGELTSCFQPAVLRLIEQVIKAGIEQHRQVAICGEMAGDVKLTPLLLSFGLREFSMSTDRIPRIKEVIKESSIERVESLSDSFKRCRTLSDVSDLLTSS